MPLKMAAWAYVSLAITFGWLLCWRCLNPQHHRIVARAALAWLAISAATFFVSAPAIFFAAAAVVLIILAPKGTAERLAYFCAVLPAAPVAILWSIPFPGINYLFNLSYPGLASLVLLGPLLLRRNDHGSARAIKNGGAAFAFGILYLLLCILLDFRETSLTNGMRHALDHLLSFGLLLIAFRKVAGNRDVLTSVPAGMLVAATMLGAVGAAQAYTSWTFYDVISTELVGAVRSHIAFIRGNALRLPSTQDPIPFGVALGVSVSLIYWAYRTAEPKRLFTHLLLLAVSIVCIIETDSRGGLLALVATSAMTLLYAEGLQSSRRALVVTGLSAAGIVLLFFDPLQYFMTVDQYGTFEYRRRVFDVSVQAISYRPFLGSPTFHPIMEQLRNHDGIIDIVNAYVQIPVRYGVIGLVFFAGAGIAAAHSMLRSRAAAAQTGDQSAELTYRALAAVSIGLLVAIGTVSFLGILVHYYWVLVGFATACFARLPPHSEPSPLRSNRVQPPHKAVPAR